MADPVTIEAAGSGSCFVFGDLKSSVCLIGPQSHGAARTRVLKKAASRASIREALANLFAFSDCRRSRWRNPGGIGAHQLSVVRQSRPKERPDIVLLQKL